MAVAYGRMQHHGIPFRTCDYFRIYEGQPLIKFTCEHVLRPPCESDLSICCAIHLCSLLVTVLVAVQHPLGEIPCVSAGDCFENETMIFLVCPAQGTPVSRVHAGPGHLRVGGSAPCPRVLPGTGSPSGPQHPSVRQVWRWDCLVFKSADFGAGDRRCWMGCEAVRGSLDRTNQQ